MGSRRIRCLLLALFACSACGGRTLEGDDAGSPGTDGGPVPVDGKVPDSFNPFPCPAPSTFGSGQACATLGQQCPLTADGCESCSCAPEGWSCPHDPSCDMCPTGLVEAGGACSVYQAGCVAKAPEPDCPAELAQCTCTGTGSGTVWYCPFAECAVDAGPPDEGPPVADTGTPDTSDNCAAPAEVNEDVPCLDDGRVCPGHPESCDGQVFYDAFECVSGAWSLVAGTICDGDAGAGPD